MSKEKDEINEILKDGTILSDGYSKVTEGKASEDLEEHYKQMYKDLPPDVVKMLIDTHPLHKESSKEYAIEEKEIIKKEREEKPKVVSKPKVSTKSKSEDKIQTEDRETKKVEHKKTKSKRKTKDFEYINDDEDYEDYEDDKEEEFIYSLFSKKDKDDDGEHIDLKKYAAIAILTTISFVCIIGLVVNIFQSNKLKAENKALTDTNRKLEAENSNSEVVQKKQASEIESLESEVESLKAQLNPNGTQQESSSQTEPTNAASNSNTTQSKTYTVAAGDNLWKISQKQYGTASQTHINAIMNANGIKNANELKVGMTLKIPEVGGN